MSAKPTVLVTAVGAAIASLTAAGTLLGWSAAHRPGPDVAAPGPSPSIVEAKPTPVDQRIGLAPPPPAPAPPRLTAGTGPNGAIVDTTTAALALTFDDGPDPTWTPRVLAALRQYKVTATFCLIGRHAEEHPDLVRAIAADGHTLCNHSWNHDTALGRAGPDAIRADLLRTNAAIRAAVPDARVVYFRQPGGFWTAPVVSVAAALGMAALHWSVDPRDWTRPAVGTLVSSVRAGSRPGAVILLHDGGGNRANTVDAVSRLLPGLTRAFTLAALPTGDG